MAQPSFDTLWEEWSKSVNGCTGPFTAKQYLKCLDMETGLVIDR
jgi:hypothetical protein